MYGILCKHYHPEDVDFPEVSEGIPHFISYNAGTRVLCTYPEVCGLLYLHSALLLWMHAPQLCVQVVVLDDADVADPSLLLETVLPKEPFLLRVQADVLASMYVQRLAVILLDDAFQLPLAHPEVYRKLMEPRP